MHEIGCAGREIPCGTCLCCLLIRDVINRMHAHTFLVIPFIVEKVDFGSSESHRSVLKTLIS